MITSGAFSHTAPRRCSQERLPSVSSSPSNTSPRGSRCRLSAHPEFCPTAAATVYLKQALRRAEQDEEIYSDSSLYRPSIAEHDQNRHVLRVAVNPGSSHNGRHRLGLNVDCGDALVVAHADSLAVPRVRFSIHRIEDQAVRPRLGFASASPERHALEFKKVAHFRPEQAVGPSPVGAFGVRQARPGARAVRRTARASRGSPGCFATRRARSAGTETYANERFAREHLIGREPGHGALTRHRLRRVRRAAYKARCSRPRGAVTFHAAQLRSIEGRWCSIGVAQMVTVGPSRIWIVIFIFIFQSIVERTISDECQLVYFTNFLLRTPIGEILRPARKSHQRSSRGRPTRRRRGPRGGESGRSIAA